MSIPLQSLEEVFASREPVGVKQLNTLFDDVGIPADLCWRSVFSMIAGAGMAGHARNCNSGWQQRKPVIRQAMEIVKTARYSQRTLMDLMNAHYQALLSVCHKELADVLSELDELANEFKSISVNRRDNVETLEMETIQTIQSDLGIREKIHYVKTQFKQTIEQFQADVTKLETMNNMDHLTGLYNRRFFDRHLAREAALAVEKKTGLNLLMLDIDDFKQFNDTYGHQIGDQALRAVGNHIQQVCSAASQKTGRKIFPSRYGGEEFAVILPAVTFDQALLIAEKILNKINRYVFVIRSKDGTITHRGLKLSVSIGAAAVDLREAVTVENPGDLLLKQADAAMYEAKQAGKNQIKTDVGCRKHAAEKK